MSLQKMLVALDQTPLADQVFDHALTLAHQHQGILRLVHCLILNPYESIGEMLGSSLDPDSQNVFQKAKEAVLLQQIEEALPWLNELCRKAVHQGIQADFVFQICEVGEASRWICHHAYRWNADVIIIGNSDQQTPRKQVSGGVSNSIVHHAHCPTVIVQPSVKQSQLYHQPIFVG